MHVSPSPLSESQGVSTPIDMFGAVYYGVEKSVYVRSVKGTCQ